jgi:hypothetical protein
MSTSSINLVEIHFWVLEHGVQNNELIRARRLLLVWSCIFWIMVSSERRQLLSSLIKPLTGEGMSHNSPIIDDRARLA